MTIGACAKLQLFCFKPEIPSLSKFGPKIKIISLSWNLVPRLIQIYRIQWWCPFFLFSTGNTLFGQTCPKILNCQFKLKIGQIDLIMQKSVLVFTFVVLDQKYHFSANFVQKIKIASLSWNLVLRLIQVCKIQSWCWLFLF